MRLDGEVMSEEHPELLYHAAPICVRDKIMQEGLKGAFGEVYAASSSEHALIFMAWRLLSHYHGLGEEIEIDGIKGRLPIIVQHESVDVWTIDTTKTGEWKEGTDHSPAFFGEDTTSWYHRGDVPADSLIAVEEFAPQEEEGEGGEGQGQVQAVPGM
jgi:hypothetical protein